MLTVIALATEAVSATQDDPEGSSLTIDEILRLLDVKGKRNPHLENPLNHPQRGYLRPRQRPLAGDEPVSGEFLSLTYCGHDPFVRLEDHDNLESLERHLASNSGIVNFYITYCIAFIHGAVAGYRIAYSADDGSIASFDKHLQNTNGPQPAERALKRWVVWSAERARSVP
jgi:hypothetical protein